MSKGEGAVSREHREAAVAVMRAMQAVTGNEEERLRGALLLHAKALADAEQRGRAEGWVLCSERMPETLSWVLGWTIEPKGRLRINRVAWNGQYWDFVPGTSFSQGNVTHWRPLPPAPEPK